jgi:hypothetical protein
MVSPEAEPQFMSAPNGTAASTATRRPTRPDGAPQQFHRQARSIVNNRGHSKGELMSSKRVGNDTFTDPDGRSGTSRRRFLARAAITVGMSGAAIGGAEAVGHSPALATDTNNGVTEWINVQTLSMPAKGDGLTDDTVALRTALNSAMPGDTVYLPHGVYVTTAPLIVPSGVVVRGSLGAGVSGYGSGKSTSASKPWTEQLQPGTVLDYGAVIRPSAAWAQGSAAAPAALLFDGSKVAVDGSPIEMYKQAVHDLWIDGQDVASSTGMHGVVARDYVHALVMERVGVIGVPGNGFYMWSNASDPNGIAVTQCLAQYVGGYGFTGLFGDSTLTRCHAQECGIDGYYLNSANGTGGSARLTDCRGDLCAQNGFHVDVPYGTFMGGIQLVNCSTQRNNHNGFYLVNSSGGKSCPILLSNCYAEGDGLNNGAGGGNEAGYRLAGAVVVTGASVNCHVCTNDVSAGVPEYAILTDSFGGARPDIVQIKGGFLNCAGASAVEMLSAPNHYDIEALAHTGAQWGPGGNVTVINSSNG